VCLENGGWRLGSGFGRLVYMFVDFLIVFWFVRWWILCFLLFACSLMFWFLNLYDTSLWLLSTFANT
jgi:hypothetical protein